MTTKTKEKKGPTTFRHQASRCQAIMQPQKIDPTPEKSGSAPFPTINTSSMIASESGVPLTLPLRTPTQSLSLHSLVDSLQNMAGGAQPQRDIDDLPKNDANYTALTPLWFLDRAALVHPNRASVIHGPVRFTWADTYRRCRQLASALSRRSIGPGCTVRTC
jgi:hypothetical protein